MQTIDMKWLEPDVKGCREIAAALTEVELAELGTALLRTCRMSCCSVPPPVLAVELIGATPRSWGDAHRAFSDVRDATLQFDQAQTPGSDPTYQLLFVAENTAKVIYNATNPIGPFDASSGMHLLISVAHFVRVRGVPELRTTIASLVEEALARATTRKE
jgi:hypothetical protein